MKARSKRLNFYSDRVKIRIEGFQIAKLVDAASRSGILLRHVQMRSETEACGELAAADLKKFKKIAGARYRITPLTRRGAACRTRGILRRPVLVIGICLAAAIVIIESFFVAAIEVRGYRAIPESELRACLARSGIREGVYRPGIDWEKAEAAVFAAFPQIMWVRLVYDGRLVLLEVAETGHKIIRSETGLSPDEEGLYVPAPRKQTGYCNITASCSGYIESIDPVWGDAAVEPGDYVKKGQVLIRGQIPIESTTFEENAPKEYYVRAQGEVWARVPYRLTFRQERYLRSAQAAEAQEAQDQADGSKAPELISDRVEKTQKQAEAKAEQQIRIWAKENLPENAEIVKKSLNFTQKENIIEIGVTLEVRRQIGKEQEIVFGTENSDQQRD